MKDLSHLKITLNDIQHLDKSIQLKQESGVLNERFFLNSEEIQLSVDGVVSFVSHSLFGYILGLIPLVFGSGTILLLSVTTVLGVTTPIYWGISVGITLILFSLWGGSFACYHRKNVKKCRHILRLIHETNTYNTIVNHVITLERLEHIGNPTTLREKKHVMSVLETTKKNLLRAFETERILRQNPYFTSEQFVIDLAVPEALHMSEQVSEYGNVLNDVLQIELRIQKELQELIQNRETG